MVDTFFAARSFSTVTCGLLLGSTAWAGLAVMPSLIAADTSSHAKLAVFDGLIVRANGILPPAFLGAIASLAYLGYQTGGSERTGYVVAASSLLVAAALQIVIVPKNNEMQRKLRKGEASKEDGREGNVLISGILYWNWGRVLLSAVALLAVLYSSEQHAAFSDDLTSDIAMAARNLDYGLE